MIKITKFGGSSVADAEQFKKVKAIIEADPSRRFVVSSASGKRFKGDNKITDLLYLCQAHVTYHVDYLPLFNMIADRFRSIRDELGLKVDIETDLAKMRDSLPEMSVDEIVSRGEYFTSRLMADYLGFPFVDATDVVCINFDGTFNFDETTERLKEILKKHDRFVMPGFYGRLPDGHVRVMSRGGSDISGSILARCIQADLYENWTDVSGFLMADPKIVQDPRPIERITYAELRELSYIGAQVLHEGTVSPVREKNIPLNIRNTNQPDHPGTMIRERFDEPELADENLITGIAGRKDFSVITITKNGMSSQAGVLRQILEVLERYGINVDYLPSGIDTVSLVVSAQKVTPCLYPMLGDLQKELKPDSIHVTDNMAIVAAVGRKMAYKPGTSGRIFAKLGENGINIRMITQGPEELNIIVGVDGSDFERAIRVLYDSFVK